ncbi:carbon starvation CstA family protein [Cohnella terricola]|uniref:Carbon starvation protein A n=1 Tax=Cohnella terricola TaxID=1289167 RepID=A0A559JNE8_9BACL|nr:carbon starvation CstA family protein [Cohnella terricola]TVY01383.1 carbon starvation protein A [Cohnella terricola]
MRGKWKSVLLWICISLVGAVSFAAVAIARGEAVNAVWLVAAAVCWYAAAYRFYARFIARKALALDDRRMTPSELHNDGKDFVPTHKGVLFGHHFAAIAGAGPLVGPILATQMGYLPGTLWIIVGAVFAGAVQDFVVLFASMRRDGKSLGEMIKDEMGRTAGLIAMIGIFGIMIILLAVLALIVVKALAGSPWGTFTIAATIPIALLMGIYMRYIRPGRVTEASVAGLMLLIAALVYGREIADNFLLAPLFTLSGTTIAYLLIGYAFAASVIPVWLLLAPRDYLSTFLKIGTIAALAVGILVVSPDLLMPGISTFANGTGPVFSGNIFPFLFITIACGSVSGFHALISSGTTPKMIERESHATPIGYGAMLTESFVALMALIAACILTPGVYFAINSPAAVIGTDVGQAAATISSWGYSVTPEQLTELSRDIGESSVLSRTGGAPTLAVGMAHVLSAAIGGKALMSFWYHFAILFEALFILTTVDAGTRVGRFMVQELLGTAAKRLGDTESFAGNAIGTAICVFAWGYFLVQGVIDPLGGVNSLWALFGIANQMLAGMALLFCTTILFKMGKKAYVWVTLLPAAWLLVVTMAAGFQKLFHAQPSIGFLAQARQYQAALDEGRIIGAAEDLGQMGQIVRSNYVNAAICGLFILAALTVLVSSARIWYGVLAGRTFELRESPGVRREPDPKGA